MSIPSIIRDRVRREIEEELKDWVGRIVAELRPMKVILFGSAALGEAGERSDIDLCVILESDLSFLDRIGQVMDLYRGNREINVLAYTPAEWQHMLDEGRIFTKKVAQGRVLYERKGPEENGAC